jgi:cytochrome c5
VSMIGCVSKALAVSGLVALMVPGFVMAEGDSTLLDNIRPVGRVNVDAPAAPPAPAVEAAPAPAAAEAPAVAEAPAATPAAAPAPAAAADAGQAVYGRACIACHMTGAANAPKLGDKAAWEPRIAKGVDALLQSAINGVPGTAMPPRGTCADCSDDDLKAAVQYMVSAAQ